MMPNNQSRQTQIEQGRAAEAWDVLAQVPEGQTKRYGTLCRRLPAMIQTNGLGQTLAFLSAKSKGKSKAEDAHALLLSQLSGWIGPKVGGYGDRDGILDWVIHTTSSNYRRATTEAIAFSIWLRRFVEAKGDEWGDAGGDIA